MLVSSQLAPVIFKFFSFSALMPVRSLKFTFSNYYVWETEQGMFSLHIHMDGTQNAVVSIFSIVWVQKFTITFSSLSSFCQGSLPYAAGSQDSKEIGCIIVDRCIDFLNIHGLLAF